MITYFSEQASHCVCEFDSLFQKNQYISRKCFDSFLDKYSDLFEIIQKEEKSLEPLLYDKLMHIIQNGYFDVQKYNQEYVETGLVQYKEYFDNMFLDIDNNIVLDDEQRKAILIDEDYSLIVAGAGSGKTTTMAAKVKFLIEKKGVLPQKIILLALTNKAVEELDMRINVDFKLGVEVLTFHKLGMRFIRKLFGSQVQVADDTKIYNIIADYVKKYIFMNKQYLKRFLEAFDKEVYLDEGCLEYDNFDAYFAYYADKLYEENKENLDEYLKQHISRREKQLRTINGEFVRSIAEVRIANYLYMNGISYRYEAPYNKGQAYTYQPDFTVVGFHDEIFIEYYGLTKYYKNGTYSMDDIRYYNRLVEKKRALHKKYKTDLIELYSEYDDGDTYLSKLKQEFGKRKVLLQPRTKKEIFYRLLYTFQDVQIYSFIRLALQFIHTFKERNYVLEDFDFLFRKVNDEHLALQLRFMKNAYCYYQKNLYDNHLIDFADMINYSYRGMNRVKENNRDLKYDYLIIDEYQDISYQRYHFARKLSDLFQAKIVAVGDDWQSIFSFSGSDVELFTRFYELMGYAEIMAISKTYRNSQELIDLAGEFISQNTQQFQKNLVSNKHCNHPIEIIYYLLESDIRSKIVERILYDIFKIDVNHSVLLLGRYRDDVQCLLDSKLFYRGAHSQIICKSLPKMKIDFLTVHEAKGLGYDQVILLNAINQRKGFPSQIPNHTLIDLFMEQKEEFIEFPEERRLFYVALTRTKNKVYILCPYLPLEKRSTFIREIILNDNVLENESYV